MLDYEQALELDARDLYIKSRIGKINYAYGVSKYDEKDYRVLSE